MGFEMKPENQHNIFSVEDHFFIIDSCNLEEVKSHLYGYCLSEGRIITGNGSTDKIHAAI